MKDDIPTATVIELKGRNKGRRLTVYHGPDDPVCFHNSLSIYPQKRELRCKACGAVLDVFDAMLSLARENDALFYAESNLRTLQKRIAFFEAEERKIKSRLRSAIKRECGQAPSSYALDEWFRAAMERGA